MSKLIDNLPSLRETIATHNLLAKKSLGQHFLLDLNLTRIIAECAGDLKNKTVFEIGPGPGGLTRALLETDAKKIIAVEMDRRCIAALAPLVEAANGKLQLIEGDALKIDLPSLAPLAAQKPHSGEGGRAVVANLPYNVGTELLINWLHQMEAFDSLTLMFQSEVADRILAGPHNKTYGRLSIIAQFCCNVERMLDIPAQAFTPPPKVDSTVVRLTPRQDRPKDIDLPTLERLTAAAFGQRRKMLRSSLRPLGGEALLTGVGINPELRAENLSLSDFEALARAIMKSKD